MTQFGGTVEVVIPFSFFQLDTGNFQTFPQFLQFADGLFFVFPAGTEFGCLTFEFGKLALQGFPPFY